MRRLVASSICMLLAVSVPVVAGDYDKDKGGEGECVCGTAELVFWCPHCQMGKAFGTKLKSEKLEAALAGHTVESDKVKCEGCLAALKSDGYCDHCHVGFRHGVAYSSPVSLTLAKGQVVAIEEVQCPTCKTNVEKGKGFCSHCDAGVVAGMVFVTKADYEAAKDADRILAKAANTAKKCEGCAVAMVTDGTCPSHKVSYKDGKKVRGGYGS